MTRTVPSVIVAVCVGVVVGFLLRGQGRQAAPAAVEQTRAQAIQEAMAPATKGTVVHTFEDDAELQTFANLWRQRQGLMLRLEMLEGYWNNEQAALGELNNQVNSQYNLELGEPTKAYTLNTDRRVILEREAPAAAGQEPAADAPKTEETVVHTFADDAAMQAFAELWQKRQQLITRMAVLKAYWDSEKVRVDELDAQLAADYHMDVTKPYTLNEQSRVLIEQEAPPVPPTATSPTIPPAAQVDESTAQIGGAPAPPLDAPSEN